MRRIAYSLAVTALAILLMAPAAHAGLAFTKLDDTFTTADGSPATQAGSHPFAQTTTLEFNTVESPLVSFPVPGGDAKDLTVALPPGFVGNPTAVPRCSGAAFLAGACPRASQVGVADVTAGEPTGTYGQAVYSLDPPPGVAMKLGFIVLGVPVTIALGVNPEPPYNVVATLHDISNAIPFYGSSLKVWGVPASPAHDAERLGSSSAAEEVFLTLPRSCQGPLTTAFEVDSWQEPEVTISGTSVTHDNAEPPNPLGMTGCSRLAFEPTISAKPTSEATSSPTGLDFGLDVKNEGLTNPSEEAVSSSDIRKAVVRLPAGFSVNPSIAEGLEVCREADLARETSFSAPGEGCPQASKIGSVEVETPLLEERLDGALYQAAPYENPFGSLVGLYVVIKNPKLGIKIVQPLKVEPDPVTGQLTTVAEEMPQLPFSHFRLHFREGSRSPLATPPACGTYEAEATLYPWSGGVPVTSTSAFQIVSGPNQAPCPSGGLPPFHPGLLAGTLNNAAGAYSPFYARIFRSDSEQEITHFSIKLPPGVLGKLAGVPFCSDAAIAAAEAREGKPHGGAEELESPSCPQASYVGRTLVGSGVGPSPAYAPGKVYLAGPYHGSPLSVVAITAAKVGPFDLGTVVVREALRIDPETAEVSVDATGSDPIPHIIDGIPVHLRDIRVYVDRPEFVLNPTSCEPTSTASTVLGSGLNFGSEADDNPVTISTRFQAADCAALGFQPKLQITLSGKTHRSGLPKLKAVLTTRAGDANIGRAAVTLPASEILEQAHLEKVCPKSIWTQGSVPGERCPANSIYGHARAISPLLDEPLEGPVYLRTGYGTLLPELVAALNSGKINVDAVGEIDAVQKKGTEISQLRTTFKTVPDAPVTKFVLEMAGGKKGLLVNTTDICGGAHRAKVVLTGHNGRRHRFAPEVKASGCPKKGKGKR